MKDIIVMRHNKPIEEGSQLRDTCAEIHEGKMTADYSDGSFCQIASAGDYAQIDSVRRVHGIASTGLGTKIKNAVDGINISAAADHTWIRSTGERCAIVCAGGCCAVSAGLGSWITLTEWRFSQRHGCRYPARTASRRVDGKRIEANTPYCMMNGKITKAAPECVADTTCEAYYMVRGDNFKDFFGIHGE